MYTLIKTILPVFLLFSVNDNTTTNAETVRISEISYDDGVYYFQDRVFNGDIVDYYENDKLKFRYQVLDGRLNGEALEFYASGEIKSRRHYYISKLFGNFTEYYETGEVKASFDVKLNAFKAGEIVENVEVGVLKRGKLKKRKYDKGIIYFLNDEGAFFESSEVISILNQTHYKITDESGEEVLVQVG